jgi:hypothetical protein
MSPYGARANRGTIHYSGAKLTRTAMLPVYREDGSG